MGVIAAPLNLLVVAKLFIGHFSLDSFQSHLRPAIGETCFQVSYNVFFSCKWHVLQNMNKSSKVTVSIRVIPCRVVFRTVATMAPLGLRDGVVALLKNVSGGVGYLRKRTQTCQFVSFRVVVKPYFDVHVFFQSS